MSLTQQLQPFISLVFRGLGQIMLQNNPITGVLFLLAVWVSAPWQALAMLLGATFGTLQARICRYNEHAYQQGVFGFNSALVALAASFFYPHALWGTLALAFCAVLLATQLTAFCVKRAYSGFTSPFVLATWILLCVLQQLGIEPSPNLIKTGWDWSLPLALQGTLQAFSQVFFQGNNIAGLLIIIGLAIHQLKAAIIMVLVAAAIAVVLPLFGVSDWAKAGLVGFNAVLCCLVFANHNSYWPLGWAVLMSIGLMLLALSFGITVLTAPFVIASWCVLGAQMWRRTDC